MIRFFLLATALLVFAAPARADVIKDSVDYTLDDGVMSKAEMEAEARDMYTLCNLNVYQKRYFSCECIAGAFLQEREKLGPLALQEDIYEDIINGNSTSASCANIEQIAGETYASCISFSQNYSDTEIDDKNNEVCACTANKMARDFYKLPRLNMGYIENLRMIAMKDCRDPVKRRQIEEASAKAKQQEKIQSGAAAKNALPPLAGTPAPGTTP